MIGKRSSRLTRASRSPNVGPIHQPTFRCGNTSSYIDLTYSGLLRLGRMNSNYQIIIIVSRQNIWHTLRRRLPKCRSRQGVDIKQGQVHRILTYIMTMTRIASADDLKPPNGFAGLIISPVYKPLPRRRDCFEKIQLGAILNNFPQFINIFWIP